MAVTLDQILASTRLDLPELSRRRERAGAGGGGPACATLAARRAPAVIESACWPK